MVKTAYFKYSTLRQGWIRAQDPQWPLGALLVNWLCYLINCLFF